MRRPGSSRFLPNAAVAITFILTSAVGAYASPQTASPSISKVEPPSWWAGHRINPVRLLVRGKNLAGAQVHTNSPAIQTSHVFVNRSGSHLFVSVMIAGAPKPGSYPLMVETA